jgi:hypothetical protein
LIVDFRAKNGHAAWGFDPQLYALSVDREHGNRDVFTDKEALLAFSAQNEHA